MVSLFSVMSFKCLHSHIPVIILTAARLDPSDVQSGLNLGADDYVTKPFERHKNNGSRLAPSYA